MCAESCWKCSLRREVTISTFVGCYKSPARAGFWLGGVGTISRLEKGRISVALTLKPVKCCRGRVGFLTYLRAVLKPSPLWKKRLTGRT